MDRVGEAHELTGSGRVDRDEAVTLQRRRVIEQAATRQIGGQQGLGDGQQGERGPDGGVEAADTFGDELRQPGVAAGIEAQVHGAARPDRHR